MYHLHIGLWRFLYNDHFHYFPEGVLEVYQWRVPIITFPTMAHDARRFMFPSAISHRHKAISYKGQFSVLYIQYKYNFFQYTKKHFDVESITSRYI